MSLTPGTRIASYEIVAALGAGAMGEVFRARDTNLGRDVAIKVLPEEFAQDEERLQRFVREARLLAQLNHPGIAGVFGLETEGDSRFIVMELVDGETLGARIARGPIPWRDALEIAVQVADALDAAHEAGIVHRDLKPDNVGLTADETAKLLDFGIGKPMNEELQRAVGSSQQMTQAGAILGTPTYICPEQFKGKPVDRRADIWAFGCLLYEMLTGAPAFPGETVGEIAAGVLNNAPDWTALPNDTPTTVRRLLADCLEKDPRERFRDIGEARRLIQHAVDGEERSPAATVADPSRERSWWGPLVVGVTLACLAMWAIGSVTADDDPEVPSEISGRVTKHRPDGTKLLQTFTAGDGSTIGLRLQDETTGEEFVWVPAPDTAPSAAEPRGRTEFQIVPLPDGTASLEDVILSGDGSTLGVLVVDEETRETSIWVRRLDTTKFRQIAQTDRAESACLSPDGTALAFVRESKLHRLDIETGLLTPLCRAENIWREQPAWGDDGQILFTDSLYGPLRVVDADGGDDGVSREATILGEGEKIQHLPTWLAPGSGFLVVTEYLPPSERDSMPRLAELVLHQPGKPPTSVCTSKTTGWPVGDWLLHKINSRLLARRFNPDTGAADATPHLVADHVRRVRVARDGVVAFQIGPPNWHHQLVWMDPSGSQLANVGEPGSVWEPVPSPVDDRIAACGYHGAGSLLDLWIFRPDRGRARLTQGEAAASPVWSPDGTKIAYVSENEGTPVIYWRAADGSGGRTRIDDGNGVSDWSADGQWLCYNRIGDGVNVNMRFRWVGDISGAGGAPPSEPVRDLEDDDAASVARFSPDGKWITYAAGEGRDRAVYIRPFVQGFGTRVMVSEGPGDYPDWSPTANEIVFVRDENTAMRVELAEQGDGTLQAKPPEPLFEFPQVVNNAAFEYSHDGLRILANRRPKPNLTPLTVITGWAPPEE